MPEIEAKIESMTTEEIFAALDIAATKIQQSWFCCDCPHKGKCSEGDEECRKHIILWILDEEEGQ